MNLVLSALQKRVADSVVLEGSHDSVTSAGLLGAIDRDADLLRASGARRVGLIADNGSGWAVADLAMARAGVVAVPLPGYFTAAQLTHAIDSIGIDAMLTDQPERMTWICSEFRPVSTVTRSGLTLLRRRLAGPRPIIPEGTTKVTLTSGSTGTPKGVCLMAHTLGNVVASVVEATAGLAPGRHLCVLPLATLLENVAGLYAAIVTDATCVIPPAAATGMTGTSLDVPRFLGAITGYQPQSLIVVPQLLLALVVAAEKGWRPPASLKFIAVGGARTGAALLQRAAQVGLPACEGYGLSECGSVVTLNSPRASRAGTVGKVLPHARVRVARDGEIFVGGSVMAGYVGSTATVAPKEIATGDLGELDEDGFLTIHGRKKNLFVTSFGRNVSPEWVESELLQAGAGMVLVTGEARPYNVALIGNADATPASINAAVARANAKLPDYAQVAKWARAPDGLSFENGTLTANGRLRRDIILKRHRQLIDELYAVDLVAS